MDETCWNLSRLQTLSQSKPMKIVSISFLLLVAFPIHLMAQDSSDVDGKYLLSKPMKKQSGSYHIVEPFETSNLRSPNREFTTPEIKLPQIAVDFTPSPKKLESKSSDFVRVAKLEPVSEIRQQLIVEAPDVSVQDFNNVTRPTPSNTNPIISEPPAPAVTPEPVGRNYQEVFRQEEPARESQASAMPERVSLDDIRMSQRGNEWNEAPVSQMRDIVDHFSPGGEPFAQRGIVGTPNFFGVDRNSCCDEWAGYAVCSGGLKQNPGHYGIPFLRSKDSCDPHTTLGGKRCGCRSCQPKKTCGCAACSK